MNAGRCPRTSDGGRWVGGLLGCLTLLFLLSCFPQGGYPEGERGHDVMKEKERKSLRKSVTPPGDEPVYAVGFSVLEEESRDFEGRSTKIRLAVWYPSSGSVSDYRYFYGKHPVKTQVVFKGPVARGHFPLILYSHGATGCGLSMAFLSEALAADGFIVVAPDYPDEYYNCRTQEELPRRRIRYKLKMLKWAKYINEVFRSGAAKRATFDYRPRLAHAAIDRMIRENSKPSSLFYGSIDTGKVGAVGHSFGAWTSFLLGGADPVYQDRRIDAVVCFSSPVHEGVYAKSELKRIKVPFLIMYGEKEKKSRGSQDRDLLFDSLSGPKYLVEIRKADHFTFSGGIREEYPMMKDYREKDKRRKVIVDYTRAFLRYYLLGDQAVFTEVTHREGDVGLFLHNESQNEIKKKNKKER